MAKAKSFTDKVAKKRMAGAKTCPKCGEVYSYLKRVAPYIKGNSQYGFNESIVKYCKCDAKEVIGG